MQPLLEPVFLVTLSFEDGATYTHYERPTEHLDLWRDSIGLQFAPWKAELAEAVSPSVISAGYTLALVHGNIVSLEVVQVQ